MPTIPLQLVAQAVADGSGRAVAVFPTVAPWHRHTITRTAVTTTSTARTSATVYRGEALAANQLDVAPYSGNDDTSDTAITLEPGQWLTVVWDGADSGARCTVTIDGTDDYSG